MQPNLKVEDKTRIEAATQAVVNVRVMREIGELVAKINDEERVAKRFSLAALVIFVTFGVLALVFLWRDVDSKRNQPVQSLSKAEQGYFEQFSIAMREASRKPCDALPASASGKLTISLQVAPVALFGNLRLRFGSGNSSFDDAVMASVRTIQPLPPSALELGLPTRNMEIIEELLIKDGKCDIAMVLDVFSSAYTREPGATQKV